MAMFRTRVRSKPCSSFGGKIGLQGFCYSLYFLGVVDVLYALDVLCEMQGLA